MAKQLHRIILFVTLSGFVIYPAAMGQEFAGGEGTSDNPWQVATAEHLDNVRNYIGPHPDHSDPESEPEPDQRYYFIQTADIDLGVSPWNVDEGWEPIGNWSGFINVYEEFFGSYDGGGYSVSGLTINRPDSADQGLFGRTRHAILMNISLVNVSITGSDNTGALVGYGSKTTIDNCHATGSVTGDNRVGGVLGSGWTVNTISGSTSGVTVTGGSNVGGISGYASEDTITGCSASGNVTGTGDHVGGLVGYMVSTQVDDCHASGTVTGGGDYTGGLAGWSRLSCTITNSSASGDVYGVNYVGGLVGRHADNPDNSLADCHAEGMVTGTGDFVGGLAGEGNNLLRSYATGPVAGVGSYVGGLAGRLSYSHQCYATGDVTGGGDYVGGLAGSALYSIHNNYATGSVEGSGDYVGGLAGYSEYSGIRYCYSVGRVTGQGDHVGGLTNGGSSIYNRWNVETSARIDSDAAHPRTSDELRNQGSFHSWDFSTVWAIDEGNSYPYLQYRGAPEAHHYPPDHVPPSWLAGKNEAGFVALSWNAPSIGEPAGYNIYRNGIKINSELLEGTTSFEDHDVVNYEIYLYEVTAVYENGGTQESARSNFTEAWAHSGFAGGDGSEGNPYRVATPEQLFNARNYPDGHFLQTADITWIASPLDADPNWTPIGRSANRFTGSYNGAGHEISGLTADRPAEDYVGLFGYTENATLTDIVLVDAVITGNDYVGALAGYSYNSVISGCEAGGDPGTTVSGRNSVGGLVGYSHLDNINSCSATVVVTASGDGGGGIAGYSRRTNIFGSTSSGSVTAGNMAGGLTGANNLNDEGGENYIIEDCLSDASVTVVSDYGGGLVGYCKGYNGARIEITNSHAAGDVSGSGFIGGMAGYAGYVNISRCRSTGNVLATGDMAGGIAGKAENYSTITESFSAGETVAGNDKTGGIAGEIALYSVIENSYSAGSVSGNSYVGGVAGTVANWSEILETFSFGEVTGNLNVGEMAGSFSGTIWASYFDSEKSGTWGSSWGEGRTTEEMTYPYSGNTFVDWDFYDIWGQDVNSDINQGYPFLQWQAADSIYTVAASAGENGAVDPEGTMERIIGTFMDFIITPEPNHHILNVFLDDESILDEVAVDENGTGEFSLLVTGNHDISAVFRIDSYIVTASAGENGTIEPEGEIMVDHGSQVVFEITAATGYRIGTLEVDGNPVTEAAGETAYDYTFGNVTAPHTIGVTFEIRTYSLTYSAGENGYLTGETSQTIEHGSDGSPVTAAGHQFYQFARWSDGITANPRTDTNVTGDIAVEAIFEPVSFTITSLAGENGSIDPEGETEVTYNTDAAFLITADEGYHISRLRIDDLYNINDAAGFPEYTYTFEAVANDHTIEATFAVNSYYISAIISPEGTGQVLGGGYYDHGSEVRLEANPWPGYRFDHWKEGDEVITGEDGAPAGAVYEFIATAGRELTAFFKEMDYVVTFTVVKENESPVTGATITVSQGTDEVAVITTGSDGKASIPLVPGSYDYAVTAEEFEDDSGNFNLSDMDLEITVTMLHTGITGVSPPNGRIMVYPNPGDGLFHVEYEGTEGTGLKTEVMSVTGNLVYVGEFHGTGNLRETIDLRHVSRGVYFLRVNDNGRISTLKLIFR